MTQIPLYADHHRPALETPFKWRFAGMPIMARPNIDCWLGSFAILRGLVSVLLKNHYIFVIFQGPGVRTPSPPPSGSAHEVPSRINTQRKKESTETFVIWPSNIISPNVL